MKTSLLTILLFFHITISGSSKPGDLFKKLSTVSEAQVLQTMASLTEKGSLTEKDIHRTAGTINKQVFRELRKQYLATPKYQAAAEEIAQDNIFTETTNFKKVNGEILSKNQLPHDFLSESQKLDDGTLPGLHQQRILGFTNAENAPAGLRNLKIHWNLEELMPTAQKHFADEDQEVINRAVADVIKMIEKVDSVVRALFKSGNELKIENKCPKTGVKKTGFVNAHFLVFVMFSSCGSNVYASASRCLIADPSRGYINISPILFKSYLKASDASKHKYERLYYSTTLLHELFHILGFNDMVKQPVVPDNYSLTHVDQMALRTSEKYISPRDYWHTNEAYFPNDLMIPSSNLNSAYTPIITSYTLRYLELYNDNLIANKNIASNDYFYNHLANLDDFFNYSCEENSSNPPKYDIFCPHALPTKLADRDNRVHRTCSANRLAVTTCGNVLPNKCRSRAVELSCISGEGTYENLKSKRTPYFGNDSRCFDTSDNSATCLKHSIEGGKLYVYNGVNKFECKKKGEVVKLWAGSQGLGLTFQLLAEEIKCPDPAAFIRLSQAYNCPGFCKNNGVCINGRCNCYIGYSGNDCSNYTPGHTVHSMSL